MTALGLLLMLTGAGCTDLLQPTVRQFPHAAGPTSMRAAAPTFEPPPLRLASYERLEARARAENGPSRGGSIAMIVTGSLMLGAAALSGLGSVPFWLDALDLESGSGSGFSSNDMQATLIGGALSAVAVATLITGAILLPVGIGRLRAASAASLDDDAHAWSLEDLRPIAAVSPSGALLGISTRF